MKSRLTHFLLAGFAVVSLGLIGCSGDQNQDTITGPGILDSASEQVALPNLVDTAIGAGDFGTLVTAVVAADLVDALADPNVSYTVLAPNDAAFGKFPPRLLNKLLDPQNKDLLAELLLYHVIPVKALEADVRTLDSAPTLQGSDLNIRSFKGRKFKSSRLAPLYVDFARVIATDIEASNGVIHVVNRVLVPKGFFKRLNQR